MRHPAIVFLSLLARASAAAVSLTLDGAPAVVGNFTKGASSELVFSNGLLTFALTPSGAGMQMTQWRVAGSAANLAETSEETWYQDWSGGKNGAVAGVDTLRVLRVSADAVEVALADTLNPARRLEQHVIMTAGVRGVFTFTVMTVVGAGEALNEVRHNTRWDRCLLNAIYNHERGAGQTPTYAYLESAACAKVQDETWRVDGRNNASLPCPADNAGDALGDNPPGAVFTKYEWALYHAENPFFGHFGVDAASGLRLGVWLTPLGGVTNATSAATYGVGPQHQDLAVHQDGLILNYMGANHYGLPAYPVPRGYTRFYGPFLHHSTVGDASAPLGAFFAAAAAVAAENIALANVAHPAVVHALYPAARATVTGRVAVSDGRPAGALWVALSTQRAADVFGLHEPVRYVATDAAGAFAIPGVPPGEYTLYLQAAAGSITDIFVRDAAVTVPGAPTPPTVDVGLVAWAPADAGRTTLFEIGQADRMGGEFALGREPRGWALPGRVPGDLVYTVGASRAAEDWFYAQTQPGTWAVVFALPADQAGTAYLTVAASMTDGDSPAVAVNGDAAGIAGAMPAGDDSTLSRQAVRSGVPRCATLTFDAARLKQGNNTISFSRGAAPGGSNDTGMGWDYLKLQV